MKKLSTVRVAGTSPTTLLPSGQRMRISCGNGEVVLSRVSWFGNEEVLLRYSLSQLALVKCDQVVAEPMGLGPVLETMQVFRNTEKYGFWDGMAATNLQNMNARPSRVPVLKLGFLTPNAEYEMQAFLFSECWGNQVPLSDTAAYLRSRLIQARRSHRNDHGL